MGFQGVMGLPGPEVKNVSYKQLCVRQTSLFVVLLYDLRSSVVVRQHIDSWPFCERCSCSLTAFVQFTFELSDKCCNTVTIDIDCRSMIVGSTWSIG